MFHFSEKNHAMYLVMLFSTRHNEWISPDSPRDDSRRAVKAKDSAQQKPNADKTEAKCGKVYFGEVMRRSVEIKMVCTEGFHA